MNKQEFFNILEQLLKLLPKHERERMKVYYDEIIEDYIENGFTEEEAVEKLGNVGSIAEEIIRENKQSVIGKEKMSGGTKALVGTLLVLGSPLWGALLLAGLALLLAFYILLFVPVILFGAFIVSFLALTIIAITGAPFLIRESIALAVLQFGVGVGSLGVVGLSAGGFAYAIKFIKKGTKETFKIVTKLFKSRVVNS